MSDKERIKNSLATMTLANGILSRFEDDFYARHEADREIAKIEHQKAMEKYHQSKEYRDLRAKKKANKKLRKKSQGR